jgi:imidazole glycerol phosphate synthase glutamine amidotransferase subunit
VKVAVLDYGAGNLASFEGALMRLAIPFVRAERPEQVPENVPLLLPGVGHFAAAKRALQTRGLWDLVRNEGLERGVLGICLGLQLLCEGSEEAPDQVGFGFLNGVATRFLPPQKVPHMGWNELESAAKHAAFEDTHARRWAYFVHSYALPITEQTTEVCTHGVRFTASAANGNILGMQHHPEKSAATGLAALSRAILWLVETRTQRLGQQGVA